MRQRSLAASTRSRNAMLLGKVESQYLVGSFSPSGHSISNHSFVGSLGRSWPDATWTRTRANREDSHSLVPSRHWMMCQALARSPRARSLTETVSGASRCPFFGARLGRLPGFQQRHVARKTDLTRPADLFERNLRLGLERDLLRHPRFGAAIIILGPGLR